MLQNARIQMTGLLFQEACCKCRSQTSDRYAGQAQIDVNWQTLETVHQWLTVR